jgi:hypothetical protein
MKNMNIILEICGLSGNVTIEMSGVQSVHFMGGVVGVFCRVVWIVVGLLVLVGCIVGLGIGGCCGGIGLGVCSGLRLEG